MTYPCTCQSKLEKKSPDDSVIMSSDMKSSFDDDGSTSMDSNRSSITNEKINTFHGSKLLCLSPFSPISSIDTNQSDNYMCIEIEMIVISLQSALTKVINVMCIET